MSKDLEHAERRKKDLELWLLKHHWDHQNWDTNVSDLHNVNLKIAKMTEKIPESMRQSIPEMSTINKYNNGR